MWNTLVIPAHLDAGESQGSSSGLDFVLGAVVSARCSLMTAPGGPPTAEDGCRIYTSCFELFSETDFTFSFPCTDIFLISVDPCLFHEHIYVSILGFTRKRCCCYCANGSILCHLEVPRGGTVSLGHTSSTFCLWSTSVCSDPARCSMLTIIFPTLVPFSRRPGSLSGIKQRDPGAGHGHSSRPSLASGHSMYPKSACIPPHVHTYLQLHRRTWFVTHRTSIPVYVFPQVHTHVICDCFCIHPATLCVCWAAL